MALIHVRRPMMRPGADGEDVNLWLSSRYDLDLAARLHRRVGVDVVVHGTALAKYRPSRSARAVGHLHWLDDDELGLYGMEKRRLEKAVRAGYVDLFASACDDSDGRIDRVFAGVLEQLFMYCRQGCFDALAFARSAMRGKLSDKRVNVVAGGDYRLVALVGLIWWLAVLRRYGSPSLQTVWWTSKTARSIGVPGVGALLDPLSRGGPQQPFLHGRVPEGVVSGVEPTTLMWVGAVRFPRGWGEVLRTRTDGPTRVLRIAEHELSGDYARPCLELSTGTTASVTELATLLERAEEALRGLSVTAGSGGIPAGEMAGAVESYFRKGVAPFIVRRIAATVDAIDARLSSVDLRGVASGTAPFLESVALHQWAGKRGVLPFLLPHSWTSSHEFPAATYRKALTFVRSDLIMPSALDDSGSLAKEEVVDLTRVSALHSSNSAEAPVPPKPWRSRAAQSFVALPIAQKVRVGQAVLADAVGNRVTDRDFARRVEVARPRVGYLLNYEHHEFNAAVELGRFFEFVADLGDEVRALSGEDASLIVRRKPGWTNLALIRGFRRKTASGKESWLASPSSMSLQAFGALCDVVLFTQSTTAVPELMSFGTPVVQLERPSPTLLVEPYVVLPESVAPRMTLSEVVQRLSDGAWAPDLGREQRRWIEAQMTPS